MVRIVLCYFLVFLTYNEYPKVDYTYNCIYWVTEEGTNLPLIHKTMHGDQENEKKIEKIGWRRCVSCESSPLEEIWAFEWFCQIIFTGIFVGISLACYMPDICDPWIIFSLLCAVSMSMFNVQPRNNAVTKLLQPQFVPKSNSQIVTVLVTIKQKLISYLTDESILISERISHNNVIIY